VFVEGRPHVLVALARHGEARAFMGRDLGGLGLLGHGLEHTAEPGQVESLGRRMLIEPDVGHADPPHLFPIQIRA
jgi:hypothetical protein